MTGRAALPLAQHAKAPLSAKERFLACHEGAHEVTRPAEELPGYIPGQAVFIRGKIKFYD